MITDIRLQNFRSYKDESFEIDPGVNIIVGPNTSGKTNLLEAVLVLGRGGSYRAKDVDLIGFGSLWARLDAHTQSQTRTVKLKVDSPTKSFEIDEQPLFRLHTSKTLPIVLFEPNDLLLLNGVPEVRRAFLDDIIEQTNPDYGSVRRHYRRVLSQRNTLLKRKPNNLADQLFVWDVRLSELGGKIARDRNELTIKLSERVSELYKSLSNSSSKVEVTYISRFPVDSYETNLLHKLGSDLELDVLRGFTAHGPHREDFTVTINRHDAHDVASRGEVRTVVLALKLIELQLIEEMRNDKPLLLLDDVFSELDTKRRQTLTKYVSNYQTFITTTDADVVVNHFTSSNIIPLSVS